MSDPVPVGSAWLDTRAPVPAGLAEYPPERLRRTVTAVAHAPDGKLVLVGRWQVWSVGDWVTVAERRYVAGAALLTLARFQRMP